MTEEYQSRPSATKAVMADESGGIVERRAKEAVRIAHRGAVASTAATQGAKAAARVLLADMRRYNDAMGNLPISKQPARLATVSQHVRAYAQLIGVWPLTATASPAQEGSPGAGTETSNG